MYAPSALARNSAAAAMSSGCAGRCSGMRAMNAALTCGRPVIAATSGVSVSPGDTVATRIPCSPSSRAALCPRLTTPALAAE